MPSLNLTFANKVNDSLQVGDTLYYTNNGTVLVQIGQVTSPLTSFGVQATVESTLVLPTANSFILFSKDNKANLSSLVGYFAEVEMTNDSTSYAELFSVNMEIAESSK